MDTPAADRRDYPVNWYRRASRPVLWWLLAIIAVSLGHPFLAEGRWLMTHMFTLGAASTAVLVWTGYFTDRVLRIRPDAAARRAAGTRVGLLTAGVAGVLLGRVGDAWPVTVGGSILIAAAFAWHALRLAGDLRAHAGRRFRLVPVHFLISAALMPPAAGAGAWLASPAADAAAGGAAGLLTANAALLILGVHGVAVAGMLITLHPALWRTRMGAPAHPGIALGVMLAGLAATAAGGVAGSPAATSAGLGLVAAGWVIAAIPWAAEIAAVAREPRDRLTYPPLSAAAAVAWLIGSAVAGSALARDPGFSFAALTLPLTVGFAAQLLIGLATRLLPATLGGGPRGLAAGIRVLERAGGLRWGLLNLGLLLWLLPLPSWTRVAVSAVTCLALVAFLPLARASTRAQLAAIAGLDPAEADTAADADAAPDDGADPAAPARGHGESLAGHHADGRRLGAQVTAAAAILALVVGVGAALGGGSRGSAAEVAEAAGVAPTGDTVEVTVTAREMSYLPEVIRAEPGDRLVITMVNADDQVHDLKLATGEDTGRVAPGESATIELPVVPGDVEGWCTIAGHRQMGMTLRIDAGGPAPAAPAGDGDPAARAGAGHAGHAGHGGHGGAGWADHPGGGALPGPESPTVDPALAPAEPGRVHRVTLRATEFAGYAAPGVEQEHWTFNGAPVGPTLRGRVGDEFVVTLVNDGTMSHSVDFHAGMVSPDDTMRSIAPGESLEYRFRAEHAGIWLYHCSTAPMSHHIAAGMHGAVVVDPPDLAPVDHEFVLVQSEAYWGEAGPDGDKIMAEAPDAYRFNGYPDQYLAHPIRIRAGETVRFWVLAAGPNRGTSFHVVGTQFHRVWKEGALRLDDGAGGGQALDLAAAQGGYVEARFPEPGTYTFVDHQMVHAEMGARGHVIVE